MGIVKAEDAKGATIDGETVCMACMTGDEVSALKQSDLITEDDIQKEDNFYFCDRCEGQIE
ncbi:MAG: hypothetical protein ACLQVJ_10395 [Syntrophobacteraceae bacterium]